MNSNRHFRISLAGLLLFLSSSLWAAPLATTVENLNYKSAKGDKSFSGKLIYPKDAKGKLPGILMVHNWMGVSEETETQAKRFAELGYVVLAADVYGEGVRPKSVEEAGKLAGQYRNGDRAAFRENLLAGLTALQKNAKVDTARLAAVGYCFGGTGAIELARAGAPIKGAISFHGQLDSPRPADGKNIKAKVIALAGADDPYQKAEDLAAFEKEMRDNKVDWQLVKFGNTVHSFTERSAGTDPSKGAAYNEASDKRSFADAEFFLKETLK